MVLKIAWRNIWRNPVRSGVVIMALTIGMYAGVFSTTFMNGWMMQRLRAGIETETAHIQIHKPGFEMAEDVNHYFEDEEVLLDNVESIEGVAVASSRIVISGMVASAQTAQGGMVIGVDSEKDTLVVNVSKQLIEGAWLKGIKQNPIVIGKKLADKLKLKIRSKIIVRFQDYNGDFTGGAFRVTGIYKTINTAFDETHLFVNKSDLRRISVLPQGVAHEMVIRCSDPTLVDAVCSKVSAIAGGNKVENWREISPELGYLTEMMSVYMYIFVIIILMALGFGIVNTMLMVVLERVHELGMLMAVGMKKERVFIMIMAETIMLSGLGGFIGIFLGVLTTKITSVHGINLSMWDEALSEMGFASIIYPEYDFKIVATVSILVILTGVVAAVYPSYKALKLNPSQALQSV
ncbi:MULTISPECIES: ABC transporter permease [unclassified Saccharicrinis]|uniref:ABC transporter permease n=1 Tax=unclassified Saccharicrinis TaxID=2646859 RepID=UPI003D34AA8A